MGRRARLNEDAAIGLLFVGMLALGVLMPDPGGVAVVPAAPGLGPAVPVDLPGRDQALRFGTLATVCDHLQRLQQELATPATAPAVASSLSSATRSGHQEDDNNPVHARH